MAHHEHDEIIARGAAAKQEVLRRLEQGERDRKELINLRVAMARIAQTMDIKSVELPGAPETYAIEHLHAAASNTERGWHKLAANIIHEIEAEHDDVLSLLRATYERLDSKGKSG